MSLITVPSIKQVEYRLARWFQITPKHTFLPQTKRIGLISCLYLCKAPSTASLSEIRDYSVHENHFTHSTAYKKLRYLSSSHKLAPWENQCWQPELISCLSAWVTHPAPPASHPCPNPALTSWRAWAGKHLPSWGFKVNQNGGKETQSWQLCLGSWKESSHPPSHREQSTSHISHSYSSRERLPNLSSQAALQRNLAS